MRFHEDGGFLSGFLHDVGVGVDVEYFENVEHLITMPCGRAALLPD